MKKILKVGVLAALLVVAVSSQAAMVITGTRIVFPSDQNEVTVRMSNEGEVPSLVQVWLDDGDPDSQPKDVKVPFVVAPPMFRVEPGKGQTVRVLSAGAALPQDRETLFWFNMLEVGPKPGDSADNNYMQMAFRTRIKMFYRPKALNSTAQIEDAYEQLRWSAKRGADGSYVVRLDNPTPYHVNLLGAIVTDAAGKPLGENEAGGMAAPHAGVDLPLKGAHALPASGLKVQYRYVNDFGGAVTKTIDLAPVVP